MDSSFYISCYNSNMTKDMRWLDNNLIKKPTYSAINTER